MCKGYKSRLRSPCHWIRVWTCQLHTINQLWALTVSEGVIWAGITVLKAYYDRQQALLMDFQGFSGSVHMYSPEAAEGYLQSWGLWGPRWQSAERETCSVWSRLWWELNTHTHTQNEYQYCIGSSTAVKTKAWYGHCACLMGNSIHYNNNNKKTL